MQTGRIHSRQCTTCCIEALQLNKDDITLKFNNTPKKVTQLLIKSKLFDYERYMYDNK